MKKNNYIIIIFFVFGIYFLSKPIYYYSKGILSQYIIGHSWEKYKKTGNKDGNLFNLDILGKIIIPSVDINQIILDGTTQRILSFGPGRVKGSSTLEDSNNNITIAAHRDSFFNKLKKISINDVIVIEHFNGRSKYIVSNIDVIDKSMLLTYSELLNYLNNSNIDKIEGTLTLFTCYPFEFIGAAPERFVVTARKV